MTPSAAFLLPEILPPEAPDAGAADTVAAVAGRRA
jgi:hypothetical protein